jgi:diguanylate cyclase (GGDEF)-like protein
MLGIFEKRIFVDPLTKLPNFFSFIESDVQELFGRQGTVILFDFVEFDAINTQYGRETGDLYLKLLAQIIKEEIETCEKARVFRTDGDEFTVVLPNTPEEKAFVFADKIRLSFLAQINKYDETGIHSLVIGYSEEIESISKFYNLILEKSLVVKKGDNGRKETRWIEDIIDSFTRRIRETLSNFNDAYVLAMADDISGLPNHRAGKKYLSYLIEESRMKSQNFSVLFIDGDDLRRYNEISYQTGNKMIRELSEILNNSIRKDDRIFRWLSGDEFLVVLPDVNTENALRLAERTRKAVEDKTSEWVHPVTISIGVAHYSNEENDIDEIISKAEKANQLAKKLGKNRVVNWNISHEKNLLNENICS